MEENSSKTLRILGMYSKLQNGFLLNKIEEAQIYGVNERSIQRDIEDIRSFLETDFENTGLRNTVIYDYQEKGYKLERQFDLKLSNSEILAVCKILLDSRALPKSEMTNILDKVISCCVPKESQRQVGDLVRNEMFHYVEPRHGTHFLETMWKIGQAINECRYIEIGYKRLKDKKEVSRKLKPLAIMFSEYYFYLAAFIDDEELRNNFDVVNDAFPTIYRIDRICQLDVKEDRYRIPYKDRFEEGEFRKRIQFMHGGKLRKIKFEYSGLNIEAVLDRLPTAQILLEKNGVYTVSAEVFGNGIDMWLKSQGDNINLQN